MEVLLSTMAAKQPVTRFVSVIYTEVLWHSPALYLKEFQHWITSVTLCSQRHHLYGTLE